MSCFWGFVSGLIDVQHTYIWGGGVAALRLLGIGFVCAAKYATAAGCKCPREEVRQEASGAGLRNEIWVPYFG